MHHDAFDVVCVGLATRDTIVPMPSWPQPDGRLVVERPLVADGGPAATAAVAAARVGARVAFVGSIGDDAEGRAAIAALEADGVDCGGVATVDGPTAASVILVDRSTGTRSILHAPGTASDVVGDVALGLTGVATWVHVDHVGYRLASALRGRLSVDAGNPIPELDLAHVALYAPTRASLVARFPDRPLGRMLAAALDAGARHVVVTLGGDGAVAAERDAAWRVEGVRAPVVSTLGAGDVFHGVLVGSLATGHDLPDALRRANLAAALSCAALDGRSAAPTLDALEARLDDAPQPAPIHLEETR
jgi:sulfofructose kinase